MTTAFKLWLGFGTLTLLLVLACTMVLVRVRSVEGLVQEQSSVARPRSAAARELEINVIGFGLAVRTFAQIDDPKFSTEAQKHAAEVERHLSEYERLASTDRQRELAARFTALWREFRDFGAHVLNSKDRPLKQEDWQHLAELRLGVQNFLNAELQVDATQGHDASLDSTLRDVEAIEAFTLILLVVGGLLAVVISVAVSGAIIRHQRTMAEQSELLHTTLASIGDGVIVTDTVGRITSMNPVAESLCGWTSAEALGKPLDAVLRIVNEDTRLTVENPVTRALKEHVIVGLANHTILIAKDGTERPIDDSAAPIRSKDGQIVGGVLVFRDVTERKQAAEALHASFKEVAQLKTALDVHAIVTITDAQGRITFVSDKFCTISKYSREELLGEDHRIMNSGFHAKEFIRDLWTTISHGRAWQGEIKNLAKDGSFYWVDTTIVPFLNEEGKPYQYVTIRADITEHKQAEAALRETDRRKSEFLATLAHELRNPLAPVRAAVEFLRIKGPVDPELQWARDVIDRQTQAMTRLIDDLMDVSRINQGKIELKREHVELAKIVQGAVETSRPLIEEMGHQLTVKLRPAPVIVDADLIRLAQVFMNLLNNAAKYTDRGGRIELRAEVQGSDVVVSVKDTGIGIHADKLPTIFEMFSQVEGALSRSQGGLGIGLCLAKRLVEMHGGSVEARSEGPGKGSEFLVRLPIVVEKTYARPARDDGDGGRQGATPTSDLRILVVDDNKDAAETLAMLLKVMGNTVRTAHDGEEAVAAAREFRPHVVLCDIGMPKLNGYEACRRMKAQAWDTKMILIAVTGWGQDDDKRKAQEAGFDHHLAKPADPYVLMNLLAGFEKVKP